MTDVFASRLVVKHTFLEVGHCVQSNSRRHDGIFGSFAKVDVLLAIGRVDRRDGWGKLTGTMRS